MLQVIANSDSPSVISGKTITTLQGLLQLRPQLDGTVLGRRGLVALEQLRQHAESALHGQAIPTPRQEEWRDYL